MAFNALIKIVNSAVCVGLYYGLINTLSIRPSSVVLLFVDQPEQKLAVINGLILAQLVRFLSIYNEPLHRLLCIPHAIPIFVVSYLFMYVVFNVADYFSESSPFSLFINSFIFQLSNPMIFPSSLFARLGQIYLFRSKNKLDFLTGSLIGWSIGHMFLFLFLQRLCALIYKYRLRSDQNKLVAKWKKSITKYLGEQFMAFFTQRVSKFFKYWNKSSTKIYEYLAQHLGYEFTCIVRDVDWFVSEMQYYFLVELMRNPGRLITMFLLAIVLGDISRRPFLHCQVDLFKSLSVEQMEPEDLTKQIADSYAFIGVKGVTNNPTINKNEKIQKKVEEWGPSSVDRDVFRNYRDEMSIEGQAKGRLPSVETKALEYFPPHHWVRPLRAIRNRFFTAPPQECDSQYFFDTCRSDGKERIAFTYLPALSFFKEIMKTIGISSSTVEKPSFDKLDQNWLNKTNNKQKNLNNELKKRIEALDAGFLVRDILEKRTRVCTDQTEKTCLPPHLDPLLTGPRRGRIKELDRDFAQKTKSKKAERKRKDLTIKDLTIKDLTIKDLTISESKVEKPRVSGRHSVSEAELKVKDLTNPKDLLEYVKNDLKKESKRRKKCLTRLSGKDLESQARRRKKSKTLKSRGRKIHRNSLIHTFLPGYDPLSQNSELPPEELVTKEELKFKQEGLKAQMGKQVEKKVPRWRFLLITQVEKFRKASFVVVPSKILSVGDGPYVPRKEDYDGDEEDFEISVRCFDEVFEGEEIDLKKKKKPKKGEEEESGASEAKKEIGTQQEEKKEIGTQQEEKKEIGTQEEEKKEIGTQEEAKKEIGTQEEEKKEIGTQQEEKKEIGTQQEEKKEIGTQQEEKKEIATQQKDNLIGENANAIDEKTEQNDSSIDEKTPKNDKKTKEQIRKEQIKQEILNTYPILNQREVDITNVWGIDFHNKRRIPEAHAIRGSRLALRRKRLSLRWVDSFLHSPLFYHFITSRLDIYFKFSHVKDLVKKLRDRFKSKKERKKGKKRKEREKKFSHVKGLVKKLRDSFKSKKGEKRKGKERIKEEKRKEGRHLERLTRKLLSQIKNMLRSQQQTESDAADPVDRADYDAWHGRMVWEESVENGLAIRTLLLVFFSRFRKYVTLPSVIILKNLGRLLLVQNPEWSEDFEQWKAEVHIISNDEGKNVIDAKIWLKWPEAWWEEGFEIKVLHPFYLVPWHEKGDLEEIRAEYEKKYEQLYIMPGGLTLAAHPFGLSVNQKSLELFFSPIWDKLKPRVTPFLIVLRGSFTFLLDLIEGLIEFIIICKKVIIQFLINWIKVRSKLIMVNKSSETKKEKDSIISNEIIQESFSQIESTALPNFEEEIQNMIDRTNTIKKKIERIRNDKIKPTPGLKKNGESPKNFWKSVKRRTVRLKNKVHSFQTCLIEKIYEICLDIVLCIIKKILDNHPQKRRFNTNFLKRFCSPDLSSLSQGYVFYKLAQSQMSDKLRSVLKYRGTSFFLKTAIKESLEKQGIFHCELNNKKLRNFRTNPWKNWLRGLPHYTLSKRRWSELKARSKKPTLLKYLKSFNYFNRHRPKKKEKNVKKKKNNLETNKLEKNYRYNLLAYKFLSAETKKECYISKQKDEVSNIPEGAFMKSYLNWRPKKGNPFESKIVEIFQIDFMDKLDSYLTDYYVSDPWCTKTSAASIPSIPSIPAIPKVCVSALEIQSDALEIQSEPPIANEKIDEAPFVNLDEVYLNWDKADVNLDEGDFNSNERDFYLPRVNSTHEAWFVRHVLEPWTRYRKAPWILPSQELLKNLDGITHEVLSEEYERLRAEDVLKKELRVNKLSPESKKLLSMKKKMKENENTLKVKESKENENTLKVKESDASEELTSKVNESDASEELFLTSEDIFIDQYQKRVRKLRKKKLDPTDKGFRQRDLARIFQMDTDPLQEATDPFLERLEKTKKLTLSHGEAVFFKFWRSGDFTVTNSILSELCHRKIKDHWLQKGLLVFKTCPNMLIKNQEQLILYQVISISLDNNRKLETQDNFDLLVPEMILSSRRRRELRILNSLNFKNRNRLDINNINKVFGKENNIKSSGQFVAESQDVDRDKNEFIKLKFFLWPHFRLEDLACMNRYWFDVSNGSRFSMLRLYMYPRRPW